VLEQRGEVVVDSSLGMDVGETLGIGGEPFEIVGETSGVTFLAGAPTVFMPIEDGQHLVFNDAPLATSVATRGFPEGAPEGTQVMTNDEVITDLRRPLNQAVSTIDFLRVLLWIVAAGIIGSIVYLQAIERVRDFAVLKATGTTNGALLVGLALQAVILSLLSAAAAVAIAALLAPLLAMPAEISMSAYVVLPIVAVVVGLLASLAGLRRAVGVDPALAFGGA
jgi:putative ABC transport system permease protein